MDAKVKFHCICSNPLIRTLPIELGKLKNCGMLKLEGLSIDNTALRDAINDGRLTLSQTSPGFYLSAEQVFRKHCRKRRNCS